MVGRWFSTFARNIINNHGIIAILLQVALDKYNSYTQCTFIVYYNSSKGVRGYFEAWHYVGMSHIGNKSNILPPNCFRCQNVRIIVRQY